MFTAFVSVNTQLQLHTIYQILTQQYLEKIFVMFKDFVSNDEVSLTLKTRNTP